MFYNSKLAWDHNTLLIIIIRCNESVSSSYRVLVRTRARVISVVTNFILILCLYTFRSVMTHGTPWDIIVTVSSSKTALGITVLYIEIRIWDTMLVKILRTTKNNNTIWKRLEKKKKNHVVPKSFWMLYYHNKYSVIKRNYIIICGVYITVSPFWPSGPRSPRSHLSPFSPSWPLIPIGPISPGWPTD